MFGSPHRLLDRRFEGHLAEACAPFNCNLGLLVSCAEWLASELACRWHVGLHGRGAAPFNSHLGPVVSPTAAGNRLQEERLDAQAGHAACQRHSM